MSIQLYFGLGVVLIILGRVIHYRAVTRYLKGRGIEVEKGWGIRDWAEWSAYKAARRSDKQPITWWYVLWAIQVVLLFWVIGWICHSQGVIRIDAPLPFAEQTGATSGYTTVFDVRQSGYRQWWPPAYGLFALVAGLALRTLMREGVIQKSPPWMEKWFPRIVVGFACFWTVTTFAVTFGDYSRAVSAMRNNRAELVEGVVTQFKPMPYTGHVRESFVVQGVKFEYSDYGITAGFNTTTSHGGPIREGLAVKIWHLGGEILRLEIKEELAAPR